MTDETNNPVPVPRSGWAVAVVFLGIAAVVLSVLIVLDHYSVEKAVGAVASNDHSTAAVAVLTPVVAAIGSIVALYFGFSSTGSARGREAEAKAQEAQATVEVAKTEQAKLAADGDRTA